MDGSFPQKPYKPNNFVKACHDLENFDKNKFPRSLRIQIPRLLIPIYEIRNNRNVGHVGGEVDPSHMDATLVIESAKWAMAELVRVFHNVNTDAAQRFVDAIVDRTIPLIWSNGKVRRVLDPALSAKEKTLLLLFDYTEEVDAKTLCDWIEYSNLSVFRKKILGQLHNEKHVEYNRDSDLVEILPPGVRIVEKIIMKI